MTLSKPTEFIWDINHGLSAIKPLNLISILRTFYKTSLIRVRIAQITKLFELYDLYWCSVMPIFGQIAELLVSVLQRLPTMFSDFKAWLVSHSIIPAQSEQVIQPATPTQDTNPGPPTDNMGHQSSVKDVLETVLARFNISLNPGFNTMAVTVLSIVVPIVIFIGGFIGSGFDISARLMKSVVAVGSTCKVALH